MLGILDLPSGLSGDMMLGALVDAGASLEVMEEAVRAAGGDQLSLRAEKVSRAGLRGTRVEVLLDGAPVRESGGPSEGNNDRTEAQAGEAVAPGGDEDSHSHSHTHYCSIRTRIEQADLDPSIRDTSLSVFRALGEAEGDIHGATLEDVHFHEVGSLDAIADIVGAVAGLSSLGLTRLYHSAVCVGGGRVKTSHGLLPVPAPATLALLRGRPCVFESEAGELTTPTGAALLSVLAVTVPPGMAMTPAKVGYGAGKRDPGGRPNLARLMIGEAGASPRHGQVAVVEAALDDCTPEEGGYLIQALLEEGARDVTLTPLIMKKSRPGFLLRVIAPAEAGATFAGHVVRLSSSLGARWRIEDRLELDRRIDRVTLPDGEVRVKVASLPDGTERMHAEYEDLAALARSRGGSLAAAREEVEKIWRAGR